MQWFLVTAYVAIRASYKWVLSATVIAGVVVVVLFAAGVFLGG